MIDPASDDPAFRRFNAAVTGAICLAVAAVAYRYERDRRRWWRANEPLVAVEAGIGRAATAVRRRLADLSDVREGAGDVAEAFRVARVQGSPAGAGPGGPPAPTAPRKGIRQGIVDTARALGTREQRRRAAKLRGWALRRAGRQVRTAARGSGRPPTPSVG